MKVWDVNGSVVGGKYLGQVKAKTAEDAIDKAWKELPCSVSLCHQCSGEAENAEIQDIVVSCGNEELSSDYKTCPVCDKPHDGVCPSCRAAAKRGRDPNWLRWAKIGKAVERMPAATALCRGLAKGWAVKRFQTIGSVEPDGQTAEVALAAAGLASDEEEAK